MKNAGVDTSRALESYEHLISFDAITVDSRLAWRADRSNGGWYWKTWDVFTGFLASGDDRSIFDVYADIDGRDIRFPFWANPIPKFVNPLDFRSEPINFSFIASMAQTGPSPKDTPSNTPNCDPINIFGSDVRCRHFTGTGGSQQSASEIIYDLPNGLQGYYLAGAHNQRVVSAAINIVRDPRLMPDAKDSIAHMTGSEGENYFLNVGSSCISCHADGMNRVNNDLRDWLDNSPERLPKGEFGVTGWIDKPEVVRKVRTLYPPTEQISITIEQYRRQFMTSMAAIKSEMVLGPDKNVYVEPIIWTVEYVQNQKYNYLKTLSN